MVRPARHQRRAALVLLLGFWLSACFSYRTLDGPVPQGRTARVILTDEGRTLVRRRFGVERQWVTGIVHEAGDQGLVMGVSLYQRGSSPVRQNGQEIFFPPPTVWAIQGRALNTPATVTAFAAGGFAVFYLLVRKALSPSACLPGIDACGAPRR